MGQPADSLAEWQAQIYDFCQHQHTLLPAPNAPPSQPTPHPGSGLSTGLALPATRKTMENKLVRCRGAGREAPLCCTGCTDCRLFRGDAPCPGMCAMS